MYSEPEAEVKAPTPLPSTQLAIVLFLRATEPISYLVCFPFINQMLLDIGVVDDPRRAGFYAGIVESVFAFTELLTVFHWGSLSDRIGRKPVLLIGCAFSAVSAATFGLSKSLTMLVATRAINGLANGNVAVLKSVIGEITDESNQARAFSLFPLSLAIGTILASMVGGYLSNITVTFPVLGDTLPFLATYPYFLPSFVAGLFPALAGIVALLWMEETLPDCAQTAGEMEEVHERSLSARELLRDPAIWPLMYSFALMSLEAIAYQALLPLFFFTPAKLGGLGFSEAQIGSALSLRGIATVGVQLFVFPRLVAHVGATRLFRILIALYIPTFVLLPLLNVLARTHAALEWAGVAAVLLLGAVSNMAFACNLIMTNDAAPNRRSLGALNGLAAFFSACTRVIGPGAANALFALSVDRHVLGGNLIWAVMVGVALLGWHSSLFLKREYRKRA
ncbi:MFS general substrate transporter [Cutaneotrichosporon oleaginosum]|uniref:MFS general substrate transporter n=1 Tax=Cutaneotrichosporon oleaginosum TaxID=879819 RepID=A0A0J0XYQ9_9TREE|nr:MFS general substrate transporter [Cutaneotrichosporon oleaginosum]KLT46192.1 MFS general substrate transporter [Cutaneotrichosporon oleaginosum]TXT10199.1 hypothetical protein COLE_04133 [Cutaneotrichosporon oleaginosum]